MVHHTTAPAAGHPCASLRVHGFPQAQEHMYIWSSVDVCTTFYPSVVDLDLDLRHFSSLFHLEQHMSHYTALSILRVHLHFDPGLDPRSNGSTSVHSALTHRLSPRPSVFRLRYVPPARVLQLLRRAVRRASIGRHTRPGSMWKSD